MLIDRIIDVYVKNYRVGREGTIRQHYDHSMEWYVSEKEIKDATKNYVYVPGAKVWLYKVARKAFNKKEILISNGAEKIPEEVLYR